MIEGIILSIISSAAFTLAYERSDKISEGLISWAVASLPMEIRHLRHEEWLGVSREEKGALWQVVHALGCVWFCRFDLAEFHLRLQLVPKYWVWDLETTKGPYRLVMQWEVGIETMRRMNKVAEKMNAHGPEVNQSASSPPDDNVPHVTASHMFLSFTYPPDFSVRKSESAP